MKRTMKRTIKAVLVVLVPVLGALVAPRPAAANNAEVTLLGWPVIRCDRRYLRIGASVVLHSSHGAS